MLYELFSWVNNSEEELPFRDQISTLLDFENEYQRASEKRRGLLSEIRVARFSPDSSTTASEASQLLIQHNSFLNFMAYCGLELNRREDFSPFLLTLKYILTEPGTGEVLARNSIKINRLFSELLKENPEQTLAFYHKNQDKFSEFSQVNLMVDAEKTKVHLEEFKRQLATQKNPVTIIPLFRKFIEDTEQFSAILLWLLYRGVPYQRIVETNLLQEFMAYHLSWVESPDSQIKHLYALLRQFPEASGLVEEAGKVQSQERGFEVYALTGEKSGEKTVELKLPSLNFTSSAENFDALYHLFGEDFLRTAVVWNSEKEDPEWHDALCRVLNQESMLPKLLQECFIFLAVRCPSTIIESLAALINDDSVEKLLMQRNGAVLYLLPYKQFLQTRIDESAIGYFLKEMIVEDTPMLDIIPQLTAILMTLDGVNNAAAILVYEAILDLTLQHPESLEDSFLIKQLKKFSEKGVILEKKRIALQAQFDDCLDAHVKQVILTTESYHILEDTWVEVSRKLDLLNGVAKSERYCPSNKYRFQAHVARAYCSKHPSFFSLDSFIQALEITPEFSDRVNEYERLLIEILITIDDEALRELIISKFQERYPLPEEWMQRNYADGCIFERAVRQGNLGLINRLEESIDVDGNAQVILAAEAHQWDVVEHLCNSPCYILSHNTLKDILCLAADTGQLTIVQRLCNYAMEHLQKKQIVPMFVAAFARAAAGGRLQVVQYLFGLSDGTQYMTLVAKALKIAMQNERLNIIEFLGNLPENPLLLTPIEQALKHAALHDQLHIVQALCSIRTNAPRRTAVAEACKTAVLYGHFSIAQHLCDLPENAPTQKQFDEALQDVMVNRSVPLRAVSLQRVVKPCHVVSPCYIATPRFVGGSGSARRRTSRSGLEALGLFGTRKHEAQRHVSTSSYFSPPDEVSGAHGDK